MGLSHMSTSCYSNNPPQLPNPDPKNFRIMHHRQCGDALVVEVLYPDCTNYEGRKLLVYSGVTLKELLQQGSIDPHFCDNKKYHSPVARFEPNRRGWHLATNTAILLGGRNEGDIAPTLHR